MPSRINASSRSLVIQKWLNGLSRDLIAKECGLSEGAVSAIIVQWKQLVGIEYAEQLRELAVALRKGGFSVLELAGAVRLKNIMNQIGVGEESFREFLTETYNTCKKIGLQPYQIATYLGDLVAFGSANRRILRKSEFESSGRTDNLEAGQIGGDEEDEDEDQGEKEEEEEEEEERYGTKMVPLFSQLPEYMASLKDEKTSLEDDIAKLRKDKNRTRSQYITLKHSRDEMLKKYNMVEEQLKWYEDIRTELRKFGLSVDDIPVFVKSVRWIQDAGYPVTAIVTNFSNYADFQQTSNKLELDIAQNEKKNEELEQKNTFLEELAQKHRLMDTERDALKKMGFGYRELKRLRHTIEEIYEADNDNNTLVVGNSPGAANNYIVSKFLSDIETYYDDLLGFQRSIDQLKAQSQNLTGLRKQQQQAISAIPYVGPSITSLLRKGVTEDQILKMLVHLEKYPSIVNSISEFKIEPAYHLHSPNDSNTISAPTSNDTRTSSDAHPQVSEPKGPKSLFLGKTKLPVQYSSLEFEGKKSSYGQLHDNTSSEMSSASEAGIVGQDSRYLDSSSPEIKPLPVVNISANGHEDTNFPINIIDGNFDTCWSNKGRGSWLLLDLGTRNNVRSVKIAWHQGGMLDYYYEISLSDDAANFKNVKKGCSGGYSSSFLEYMLEQGSQGRYIRIAVKGNNFNDKAGITEIEVTGSPLHAGNS